MCQCVSLSQFQLKVLYLQRSEEALEGRFIVYRTLHTGVTSQRQM